jgi:hypothetical protein
MLLKVLAVRLLGKTLDLGAPTVPKTGAAWQDSTPPRVSRLPGCPGTRVVDTTRTRPGRGEAEGFGCVVEAGGNAP